MSKKCNTIALKVFDKATKWLWWLLGFMGCLTVAIKRLARRSAHIKAPHDAESLLTKLKCRGKAPPSSLLFEARSQPIFTFGADRTIECLTTRKIP